MSIKAIKGKKIGMIMVKNSTTSSKNAINIIEAGELKEKPVNKGLNIHNKSLIFLLEGNENFRRVIWFMAYLYVGDEKNQRYLKEVKKQKKLDLVLNEGLKEYFEKEKIKDVKIPEFKISKELNSDEETVFGYLINQIRDEEW